MELNSKRRPLRPPPFLIGTMLVCAAVAAPLAGGPSLTNILLIHAYMLLGYTTPESIVHIYNLTAQPLLRAGFGAAVGASLWTIFRCIRWRPKSILAQNVILHSGIFAAWVVALCGLAISPLTWMFYNSAPSDEVCVATFYRNRVALEGAMRLINHTDGLSQIRTDIPEIAESRYGIDPVASAKARPYRKRLETAGVKKADLLSNGGVEFMVWADGWVFTDGEEKGYCYLPSPPAGLLPSLNGLSSRYSSNFSAYRHLAGDWYLFYRHTPG